MSFFVSNAYAAGQAGQAGDGPFSFLLIGAVFMIFYFMIIRPQNQRNKAQQALLGKLKAGDEIIAAGGIYGRIIEVDEQILLVKIAQNAEIRLQKSSVLNILPKGTVKFS
jgi:preprotein translocase subunit YajC